MTAAILEIRRNVQPKAVRSNDTAAIHVCAVVPFRPTNRSRRLICRWHRKADGQLTCAWEPDIGPGPAHLFAFVAKFHRHPHKAA